MVFADLRLPHQISTRLKLNKADYKQHGKYEQNLTFRTHVAATVESAITIETYVAAAFEN